MKRIAMRLVLPEDAWEQVLKDHGMQINLSPRQVDILREDPSGVIEESIPETGFHMKLVVQELDAGE